MNNTTLAGASATGKIRYGCVSARIGAMFAWKLKAPLTLKSGRVEAAGRTIHLTIQPLDRNPEIEPHVKWVCRHPDCAGKEFATKKELVASHKTNRELEQLEESHCYHAVAHVPGQAAKEEKRGKHGEVLEEGSPARLPTIVLLADEE